MRALCASSGVKAPLKAVLPVGTTLRRSLDHLMFGQRVGAEEGEARTKMEALKASVMCGMAVMSCCTITLFPPQKTRFPLEVHLAVDTCTWVVLSWVRAALIVLQTSVGMSLWLPSQVRAAVSTTMLGH